MQNVITLDLEGVLIPEIWKSVANHTQIQILALTTRDISDYDELMHIRLNALKDNNLTIKDIQDVINSLEPLDGAVNFLNQLRSKTEVIILSDTFIEFFQPLRKKLNYPAILCNSLEVDPNSHRILSYKMRLNNGKSKTVQALKSINCKVASSGDSYNDLGMLQVADFGSWFRPPQNIITEYPQFPVYQEFNNLKEYLFEVLEI